MPSQFQNPPESFPDFSPRHGLHDIAFQTKSAPPNPPPPNSYQDAACQTQIPSELCLNVACRTRLPSSNSSQSTTTSHHESINSSTDQADFGNELQTRSMTSLYNFLCQPSVEENLRRQEAIFASSSQKQHSSQSSSPLRSPRIEPHASRAVSFNSSSNVTSYPLSEEEFSIDSPVSHLAPRSNGHSVWRGSLAITPAEHPPLPETEIARGFFGNGQRNIYSADRPDPRAILDEWFESTRNQPQTLYRYTSSFRDNTAMRSRDITDTEETYLESPSSENTVSSRAIFNRVEGSRECLESPSHPPSIVHIENPGPELETHIRNTEENNSILIEFTRPDDPEHPMNWKLSKKYTETLVLVILTFTVTFASSVFSTAIVPVAFLFGVSQEATDLGVSLFVLGFSVGSSIWGPASELYGRKTPLVVGFFLFAVFQIPTAMARNLQTILVCRFFGGVSGSAPLAIVGGALADIWDPVNRGVAVCFFSGATFLGPLIGPIAGDYITKSYLGWRWTTWITVIIAFSFFPLLPLWLSESYAPSILQQKAKRLRYEKKQWGIHSKLDEKWYTPKEIVKHDLLRPTKMFLYEPILSLITIYSGFIYGVLYLFFEAYPIAFQEQRGYNAGIGSLPFLGIISGVFIGSAITIYTTKTKFKRRMQGNGKVVPEDRLPPMIFGAIIFPIGMFWFAWTSSLQITWVPQVIASIPIGAGMLMIFLQSLNYIIDVYREHTNSALAANTMIRSLFGAGFPMFARAMFHHLGVNWACTTLGIIAAVLAPVPVLLFKYGRKIRMWGRYASKPAEDDLEGLEVTENNTPA